MHLQKQDLIGTHYIWIEQEGSHSFEGQPSRRSFDRFNGNQVLFLINSCASLSDKFTIEKGRFIEQLIQHDLPTETKSEISVLNWIKNNALD